MNDGDRHVLGFFLGAIVALLCLQYLELLHIVKILGGA